MENQLWGFARSRRGFFESYYSAALKSAYMGENGFIDLIRMTNSLRDKKKAWWGWKRDALIPLDEFCLRIDSKGLAHAEQPGHEWSGARSDAGTADKQRKSSFIPAGVLEDIFRAAGGGKSRISQAVAAQNVPAAAPGAARSPGI